MRGWIQFCALALVMTSWAGVAKADRVLPSNLGILERLTDEAVEEVEASLELPRNETVTLVASTPHEGNRFVMARLARALAEAGYTVHTENLSVVEPEDTAEDEDAAAASDANAADDGDDADATEVAEELSTAFLATSYPEGTVLDLELLEFGVHYAEAKRKKIVGEVEFTRIAGVYLRVSQLTGPSGAWVNLVKSEKHHWDRVSGRQRILAEGSSYPFQSPVLHAPSLGAYVEPVLVVGIIGSLIYLFYANQN